MRDLKDNPNVKLFQKLNNYKSSLSLDRQTKARLKESLLQQIAITPQDSANEKSAAASSIWSVLTSRRLVLSFALLFFFIGAGATAYSSQKALPGESLYKVKQAIEKARLETAMTDYNESIIESQIAHQRINEFSQLKAKERAEQIENAEQQASAQTSQAVNHLTEVQQKLSKKGNARAAAKIQSRIDNLNRMAAEKGIKFETKPLRGITESESQTSETSKPEVRGLNTDNTVEQKPEATKPTRDSSTLPRQQSR